MKDSNCDNEVLIIGGGLAGLTSAIHLTKMGCKVIVIEKNSYPKHKVCGEYISNEILPYFNWLNINIEELKPTHISNLQFSSESGRIIETKLPLGGFGISRYILDYALYKKALSQNCEILEDQVNEVIFKDDIFEVQLASGKTLTSKVVLGGFGKRSNLDLKMKRNFLQKKSPWLAVKSHFEGEFADDVVGLHNFKGGYCGVSKVENNLLNICYLTNFKSFKKYKNIEEFQEKVVSKNPHLKNILENSQPVFEKPLTISQICFEKKENVENHILMVGDTAGLIHPLCGNGMAMAIHSAKLASEQTIDFLSHKISRTEMENNYSLNWNKNFKQRLWYGRLLGSTFEHSKLSEILTTLITYVPFLLPLVIKKTHGKEITINQ
ncbi:NAD(P)/FAD-dependent oxidoreductase [Kaistella jeonii]|uniref:FAD-dependent oxidoreductase n=1 Tax=Kaistella jeonii TaxID=266749 RepID=A0A0C1D1D3_9FLAO|nr:NAD(P)/FAD-dependent oxidoreductase [Kaistella jeonii]KIA90571.1 FAD-dependent oxidoreductase [Kaistella jeonii]SFB70692.1 Dehydrogenase (flavoprotein) [Kaistella jeonii]VEI94835.1 ubiquinone biosynthesis hydroxylase family protein [Kaistella jeonii]